MFKAVFNFSDFRGRADRGEFWSFLIFAFVAGLIGMMVTGSASLVAVSGQSAVTGLSGIELPGESKPLSFLLTFLPVILLLVPAVSVTIRRLRDAGIPLIFAGLGLPFVAATLFPLVVSAMQRGLPADASMALIERTRGFAADLSLTGYVTGGILLLLALTPSKQIAEAPRHTYTQKRIRLAENDTVAHVPVFDFTSPPASDENDRQGFGRRH